MSDRRTSGAITYPPEMLPAPEDSEEAEVVILYDENGNFLPVPIVIFPKDSPHE